MERIKVRTKRGGRLLQIVGEKLSSLKKAKRLINEGLVSVNYRKELFYRKEVRKGSTVIFPVPKGLFKRVVPKLLYEDRGVWVFSKPPFITSNEGSKSLEALIKREFKESLRVVHRLDKQTSGLIIAVEDEKLFEELKEAFKRREVKKEYLALLKGRLKRELSLNSPIDGKEATTRVVPIREFRLCTLCKVEIKTGRKHQIRIHTAQAGHPVVGEFKYYKGAWKEELLYAPRILLHSSKLAFPHPKGGRVEVKEELPEDFKEFLTFQGI
ncbi:RluA family pseudouridine synthase [Thermovibrio sp.]